MTPDQEAQVQFLADQMNAMITECLRIIEASESQKDLHDAALNAVGSKR
jgi:hypothetical protein